MTRTPPPRRFSRSKTSRSSPPRGFGPSCRCRTKASLDLFQEVGFVYYQDLDQLRDIPLVSRAAGAVGGRDFVMRAEGEYQTGKRRPSSEVDIPLDQEIGRLEGGLQLALGWQQELAFSYENSRFRYQDPEVEDVGVSIPNRLDRTEQQYPSCSVPTSHQHDVRRAGGLLRCDRLRQTRRKSVTETATARGPALLSPHKETGAARRFSVSKDSSRTSAPRLIFPVSSARRMCAFLWESGWRSMPFSYVTLVRPFSTTNGSTWKIVEAAPSTFTSPSASSYAPARSSDGTATRGLRNSSTPTESSSRRSSPMISRSILLASTIT